MGWPPFLDKGVPGYPLVGVVPGDGWGFGGVAPTRLRGRCRHGAPWLPGQEGMCGRGAPLACGWVNN